MLAMSNMYKLLTQYSIKQNGDPYRNALVTPQQKDFNMSMSKVRTSVEWPYDVIPQQLTFLFLVLRYFLYQCLVVHAFTLSNSSPNASSSAVGSGLIPLVLVSSRIFVLYRFRII